MAKDLRAAGLPAAEDTTRATLSSPFPYLTLPTFLIRLLREAGEALRVSEMLPHVGRELSKLRRRDGRKYTSLNLNKLVVNVLYSSSAFVEKETGWTIDEQVAHAYETTTLRAINQRLGRLGVTHFSARQACDLLLARAHLEQKDTLEELGKTVSDLALLNESAGRSVGTDLMNVFHSEEFVPRFGEARAAGMLVMFELLQECKAMTSGYFWGNSETVIRKLSHLSMTLKYMEDKLRKEADPFLFPNSEER